MAHRRREGASKIKEKIIIIRILYASHCTKANPPRITHRLLIASVSHRGNNIASVLTAKSSPLTAAPLKTELSATRSAELRASGWRGGGENGLVLTPRVFLYSSAYLELHYKSDDVSVPEDQCSGEEGKDKGDSYGQFPATFGAAHCCVSLV